MEKRDPFAWYKCITLAAARVATRRLYIGKNSVVHLVEQNSTIKIK
jgi:hypothetical protein